MGKFTYGGQAVIEGVMMRGRTEMAVAVRHPGGRIIERSETLNPRIYQSKVSTYPFVRGLVMLWDMLVLGTKCLIFSANIAVAEEDSIPDDSAEKSENALSGPVVWITMTISIAMAAGLFFVAPLVLVSLADRYIVSSFVSNLIEGVIRLVVLVVYLWLIGHIPDIGRVFGYHGAEHKTINALEDGAPLEVESIRRYSTAHPRCGTGFLLVVMLISILVFALLGRPPVALRFLSRIVLVPVIAGISYEFIKLAAAHYSNRIVRALMAPSLALQSLTTREPDDSMLEVAIVALKRAMAPDLVKEESVLEPVAVGAGAEGA